MEPVSWLKQNMPMNCQFAIYNIVPGKIYFSNWYNSFLGNKNCMYMRVYAHACMSTCVCCLASSETRAQNQNLRANV